ncbi:MAG: translation elongation factor EF-1 gamma subunit [Amphiamblys sp. WSBS2006]|nr:MAG: translation elongation factor EF-1 gamma subunit [Amphiamblys sp. WSBS2006]
MKEIRISTAENAEEVFIAAEYAKVTVLAPRKNTKPTSVYFLSQKLYAETEDGTLNDSLAAAHYLLKKKQAPESLTPYQEALVTDYIALAKKLRLSKEDSLLAALNKLLLRKTFLLAESITIADIAVFAALQCTPDRIKYPNLVRWYETCANQKEFTNGLTKKDVFEAQHAAKIEKPKSSFELLPPTTFSIEEWKRVYLNQDTRTEALPWLYKNIDWDGHSLWKVDYCYNNELSRVFMSSNLITGLFNRMEIVRKHCFTRMAIFGEDGDNEISGFLLIRGTELPKEIEEVPDLDSYKLTKVDINSPEQKALFEDYLAAQGDFAGCTKTYNQGKTLK